MSSGKHRVNQASSKPARDSDSRRSSGNDDSEDWSTKSYLCFAPIWWQAPRAPDLHDAIRLVMLEKEVVQEVIHAEKPVTIEDDGAIAHLQQTFLGKLFQLAIKTL